MGLLIALAAVALVVIEQVSGESVTMAGLFGPGVPFAGVDVWMVLLLVALAVYLVGRVVWVFGHRVP